MARKLGDLIAEREYTDEDLALIAEAFPFYTVVDRSLHQQRPAGIPGNYWQNFLTATITRFGTRHPVEVSLDGDALVCRGLANGDGVPPEFKGKPIAMRLRPACNEPELFDQSPIAEAPTKSRFAVIESADFAGGDFIEPEWQVDERVPARGIGLEWGASGTYKSFAVYDLAACIHRGVQWRDRAVTKGRAVIVVAEGEHFYPLRIKAYAKHHNVPVSELPAIIPAPVNLFESKQVSELIAELKKLGATFCAIDTLSQCATGADENSAKDMNLVIAAMKRISREVGCFVTAVHHSGKNEDRGARGSSVLKPAVDVEVHHEAIGTQGVSTVEKLKDGAPGARFSIEMKTVELGISKKSGKPFGSLVVVHTEDSVHIKTKTFTGWQKKIMDAFRDIFEGEPIPINELESATMEANPHIGDTRDQRKNSFNRARKTLVARGILHEFDELISSSRIQVMDTFGDDDK